MKTRQNNDVTNCTSPLYAENETELLWSIWEGMVYDKDQIGQRREW